MNNDKRDKTIAGIQIMAAIGIPIMILGVQLTTSVPTLLAAISGWLIIAAGTVVFIWALVKFAKL
jgi:hypothetical protein